MKHSFQDEMNPDYSIMIPSLPLSLQISSHLHLTESDLLSPTLFGIHSRNKKASIQMKLADHTTNWSDSFSINTHGITGHCSVGVYM